MENPMLYLERDLWARGAEHVAGIDEAGRGPLAGPVVAACVVLRHDDAIEGCNDSKKLSAKKPGAALRADHEPRAQRQRRDLRA